MLTTVTSSKLEGSMFLILPNEVHLVIHLIQYDRTSNPQSMHYDIDQL